MCPSCHTPVLPQFLMFDELYESHDYYQWRKALQWIANADAYVFVGTSMAVGITEVRDFSPSVVIPCKL